MMTPPRKTRTLVALAAAGAALLGCGGNGGGGGTTDPNLPPVCEQVDLYGTNDLDAQASFSDADGDNVAITTSSNLAALNNKTGTNQIALQAYAEPARHDQQITFSARGSDGQASATCTADPVTIPGNPEPVYNTLDVPATTVAGSPVTVRWDVHDNDLDSLAINCTGCDEGRQVFTGANGSTHLTFNENGDVTFTAYDGLGAGTPQTRTVDVQRLLTQRFIASRGERNNTRLTNADGQLELFINGEKQSLTYENGAWIYQGPETGEVDVRFNGTSLMPDHFFVYQTQDGKMFGQRLGWTWGQTDRATIDLDDNGAQYELFAWDNTFDVGLYNHSKNKGDDPIDSSRPFRAMCPGSVDADGQGDGSIDIDVYMHADVYSVNQDRVREAEQAWTDELSQNSRVKLNGHFVNAEPANEYFVVRTSDVHSPGANQVSFTTEGCAKGMGYVTPQIDEDVRDGAARAETGQALAIFPVDAGPNQSYALIEGPEGGAVYSTYAKQAWSTDRVITGEGLTGPIYLWQGY